MIKGTIGERQAFMIMVLISIIFVTWRNSSQHYVLSSGHRVLLEAGEFNSLAEAAHWKESISSKLDAIISARSPPGCADGPCKTIETMAAAYKQIQHDYCVRTYLDGGAHLPSSYA
jgi:hypothetical protein